MKIVVLCGGVSTERDVSLVSGTKVYKALKEKGHNAIMLDIFLGYEGDTDGIFEKDVDWAEKVAPISEKAPDLEAVKAMRKGDKDVLFGENVVKICKAADIVFMGLHGDCGENGKVQAAFDLYGIKYTGTDYLSSALAMDKSISKKIFDMAGVSTPKSITLYKNPEEGMEDSLRKVPADELRVSEPEKCYEYAPMLPCVVKVCSGGSSVGVYIVKTVDEYKEARNRAWEYDNKVLVEEYIKGREFTDGVVDGQPLPVVEIAPKEGFYDYKNKYQAGSTVETCPAEIPDVETTEIQKLALKAYNALGIKTYARMDFVRDENTNKLYCLEANTLPGMTPTSLIPQEAAAIGVDFPSLCEWIIKISLKKYGVNHD